VLTSIDELLAIADRLYPQNLPQAFALVRAAQAVKSGGDVGVASRAARTTRLRLQAIVDADDPIAAALGVTFAEAAVPAAMRRPRDTIGQLLLGEIAERAFERIYKTTMGTDELVLEDDRESRNDTDYRVLNGQRRPVFRINIKFYGTLFRNARELVSLEPEDCFALATYKIHQGLLKQDSERLPYLFVIVGLAGVTGASIGDALPEDLAHLIALVHEGKITGKRAIEERIVEYLIAQEQRDPFRSACEDLRVKLESAEWRVLSARRADNLLRVKLFERVFAVRVPRFTRNYRNAELDMHFSVSEDLTPLPVFLKNLKDRGLHGLSVDLERGTV